MRCFIAIDLPEKAKKELISVQKQIKSKNPDIKAVFVKPKVLHINLKFLGETDDAQAKKIKNALKKLKFEPFKIKLSQAGVFTPQFIRVLWVDVSPKEQLVRLQQDIDSMLEKEGFKQERRFEAHITLARIKFVKDKFEFVKNIEKIKVKPIEFEIKNFSLKKSTLTPEGPIYEDVIKF